jgi:flagellar basal-body rod modification protein FlgD
MNTVSALNPTAAGMAATAATPENTLGQDEFLTLLVAQLQNQDPLNPTDATEFTAQLAQYSQLEQLFNLNDAMDGLSAAQTSSQKVSALSLIGKEVVVEDTHFPFDGAPTRIGYRVDGPATNISLQIRNSAGATVATLNASDTTPGEHFLTWNGLDQNGAPLPADTYQLAVTAKSASADATVLVAPLVRTIVTGVDLSGSEPLVVTRTGEFLVSAIRGVYEGEAAATTADIAPAGEETEAAEATAATGEQPADTGAGDAATTDELPPDAAGEDTVAAAAPLTGDQAGAIGTATGATAN